MKRHARNDRRSVRNGHRITLKSGTKKKEELSRFSASLLVARLIVVILERVSPVEHHIYPVAAFAISTGTVAANVQVVTCLVGANTQVRRVVPQHVDANVHARRDKIPEIPLSAAESDCGGIVVSGRRCSRTGTQSTDISTRSKCVPVKIEPGVVDDPVRKPLGLHR